tara:strand:- start:119 stop:388 length:270 start_codon:yes stop_codon:yes gene_type:complete
MYTPGIGGTRDCILRRVARALRDVILHLEVRIRLAGGIALFARLAARFESEFSLSFVVDVKAARKRLGANEALARLVVAFAFFHQFLVA